MEKLLPGNKPLTIQLRAWQATISVKSAGEGEPSLWVRVSKPPVHRRRLSVPVQLAMVWFLVPAAVMGTPLVLVFFRVVLAVLPVLLFPLMGVYALAQAVAFARLSKLRGVLQKQRGLLRKDTEKSESTVLEDVAKCSRNGIHRDIEPFLRVLKAKADGKSREAFAMLTDEKWLSQYRKHEPSQMLADYRLHLTKVLFYILLMALVYVTVLCAPFYFGRPWNQTVAAAKEAIQWPDFSLTFHLYFEWPSLLMFEFDFSARLLFYVGFAVAALTDIIKKWRAIYYATFPSEYRDYTEVRTSLERTLEGGPEWVLSRVVGHLQHLQEKAAKEGIVVSLATRDLAIPNPMAQV